MEGRTSYSSRTAQHMPCWAFGLSCLGARALVSVCAEQSTVGLVLLGVAAKIGYGLWLALTFQVLAR